MITLDLFKLLEHRWAKYGYVYSAKARIYKRLKHFDKHCVPMLKDKDVLELACNSGIFGFLIAQQAKSYFGVEPNFEYFKQADMTRSYISNRKITLINKTVKGFIKDVASYKFNALVVNYSLYRFSNGEIENIEKTILPKCDVVCIQNRTVEKEKHRNKYNFRSAKPIMKWLQKNNIDCRLIWGDKIKSYSCIVGQK